MYNAFTIIEQSGKAGKLYGGKRNYGKIMRLDKIETEPEQEVSNHKQLEPGAAHQYIPALHSQYNHPQQQQENNFIQIYGVPADTIAKIHAPGQLSRQAISFFIHAHGKTSDTPNDQRQYHGIGEQIAGRLFFADDQFHNFHTH